MFIDILVLYNLLTLTSQKKGYTMKTIQASGKYTAPDNSEVVYDFEYPVIDSVNDAIANLGEDKVKTLVQRILKVDANNLAREKAKVENGHSSRKPMSEEEKAVAKQKRLADKELLNILKSKGLTLEDLAKL